MGEQWPSHRALAAGRGPGSFLALSNKPGHLDIHRKVLADREPGDFALEGRSWAGFCLEGGESQFRGAHCDGFLTTNDAKNLDRGSKKSVYKDARTGTYLSRVEEKEKTEIGNDSSRTRIVSRFGFCWVVGKNS